MGIRPYLVLLLFFTFQASWDQVISSQEKCFFEFAMLYRNVLGCECLSCITISAVYFASVLISMILKEKLPVTVLCGFLVAGENAVLRLSHILNNSRHSVNVNSFYAHRAAPFCHLYIIGDFPGLHTSSPI